MSQSDESLFDDNIISDDSTQENELDSLFSEDSGSSDLNNLSDSSNLDNTGDPSDLSAFDDMANGTVTDDPLSGDLNDLGISSDLGDLSVLTATAALGSESALEATGKGKKKNAKVKKEKPKKVKPIKEKVQREPREKKPLNKAFLGGICALAFIFLAINAYVIMTNGVGLAVLVFLVIFDIFAAGILAIPFLFLWAAPNPSEFEIGLGIAVAALMIGCMLFLVQMTKYGGQIKKASNDVPARATVTLKWQQV